MQSASITLQSLLNSLGIYPPSREHVEGLVKQALSTVEVTVPTNSDKKTRWEFALREDIYTVALKEGEALQNPNTTYYDNVREKLDVVLTFTEQDACEANFPFVLLQELFETQTVASCSRIFSWVEDRRERLTTPAMLKSSSLPILRCLNDLLRRVSKTGSTTPFCGRILTFLSSVFTLSERSGVNLRGEYGRTWEAVKSSLDKVEASSSAEGRDSMEVDAVASTSDGASKVAERDSLYVRFWSLQLPFSQPYELAKPGAFKDFRAAVEHVLPALKEATVKERAMMGGKNLSGAAATPAPSLKRKRDDVDDSGVHDYFFAKFLTSPDLLELEIADTHFRRQFLFQLLTLLHHLRSYIPVVKASWITLRNRSLVMDFTLEPEDAQWVQEHIATATKELEMTIPNGRWFAEVAKTVIQRDTNWVRWKNVQCPPFEKERWSTVAPDGKKLTLEQSTEAARKKLREDPELWRYSKGTNALTEIWDDGYRSLEDLERLGSVGSVQDYIKSYERENKRIEKRQDQLAKQAEMARAEREEAVAKTRAEAEAAEKASGEVTMVDSPVVPSNDSPAASIAPSVTSTAPTRPVLHPSLPSKPGSVPTNDRSSTPTKLPASVPKPGPASKSSPKPGPPLRRDPQIAAFEENKQRLAWLCLRLARETHLSLFGKIGTGDIVKLAEEIEKAKEQSLDQVKAEESQVLEVLATPSEEKSPNMPASELLEPPSQESESNLEDTAQNTQVEPPPPLESGDAEMADG